MTKFMNQNKPLVSIIVITLVRTSLYSLISSLLNQRADFDYEIVLVPQKSVNEAKLSHKSIHVFPREPGLGVAYYRNYGVTKARGDILAFIDDDEIPKNDRWLQALVNPIIEKKGSICTSGTDIPLGQGYIADSISLLGYPGGAALGFKALWNVDSNNQTNHLCTGNFSIKSSLLKGDNGFDETLTHGTEDVFLSRMLEKSGHSILYVSEATINHLPRSCVFGFMSWHFKRGRAIAEFSRLKLLKSSHWSRLFKILAKVLLSAAKTRYLPMVLLLLPIQYLCQSFGFIYERFR